MSHSLYLTTEEQMAFEKLPSNVRAEVNVEQETVQFTDSPEHREVRMRNLKIEHPALRALQAEGKTKKYTTQEAAAIAETIDLSNLSESDLIELSFAWGPDVFTYMIREALRAITSPADIATIQNLAGIRHGLLLALTTPSR